jgi:hypothetical protein
LAQRFDLDNLRVLGEPTAIAERVRVFKPTGNARFTVSQTGVLAFETTINYSPRLVWFDRNGQVLDTLTMPGPIKSLRLSPDGQASPWMWSTCGPGFQTSGCRTSTEARQGASCTRETTR